jgi:hypothetical protein
LTVKTRHTARVSRAGLVIIGLILLLGAGAVLARSLNVSTAGLGAPHAPLLTHGQVQYPAKNTWVWPVVAAASFLVAALALWWMVAQTRIRAVGRIPLEPDCLRGTTTMRANVATGAMTEELRSVPGIRAADAVLHGPALAPGLRLGVTAENRADPGLVRAGIEDTALPHLRSALELDKIPTVLTLQFSRAFDRHLT